MAQIIKRTNKCGETSYLIRVSDGYGVDGRQRKLSMTWVPPCGMSERRAEKAAEEEAVRFKDAVSAKSVCDGNISFEAFTERWLREYAQKQLKIKTWTEAAKQLARVNRRIGDIKLKDLKTSHLNGFYLQLQADGLNRHTGGRLSAKTIRVYHQIISAILGKAVKWGYIPFNPAANAEPPKLEDKEAYHLDVHDARRLLEALHSAPTHYRAMISFDILSGLRRGELLGLRWRDVNFEAETIQIVQASSYATGFGLYVDTPKSKHSRRALKLSHSAFVLLEEYREWQEERRKACGEAWKDADGRVFTNELGAPINPDSLSSWFTAFAKRNGFAGLHLHSLRHTYASLMIAEGTPLFVVSRRLGHAQVSTTANIYAHVIASADEKAAQVVEMFADEIAGKKKKSEQ